MWIKTPATALLILLFLLPSMVWAQDSPLTVTVIKVNKSYYANSEAFYGARCSVKNMSDRSGKITVLLAGQGKDGSVLHRIRMSGEIKEKGKKVLRQKGKMDAATYKSITDWTLERATFD